MEKHSTNLEKVLIRAASTALGLNSERVDNEHIILSLLEDVEVRRVLVASGADVKELTTFYERAVQRYPSVDAPRIFRNNPQFSESVRRSLRRASNEVVGRHTDEVTPLDLFFRIATLKNHTIARVLRANNVLPDKIKERINELYDIQPELFSETHADEVSAGAQNDLISSVPHQSSAPVRIEERKGKISQLTEGNDSIDADELDFERWRVPVATRLDELLHDDLGPGTNHSRLRKRLLDLAEALAGTIDDVKDNQFRLGYAIEALGVLVGVYRTAADDLPTLNAAVFGDVDHLHIQLMLGQSKLVAWRRFQSDADADALAEGAADPAAVGAALEETARVLDGAAEVVDLELPRSFRWIRASIADPGTATRRMVYGAVKSVENVLSFLGQIVVRSARKTAETVGDHISNAVAASVLLALGDAALSLSGALPNHWAWLRPVLDAARQHLHL